MPGPVVSIIIASIQSVAKVFLVGAAGFFAVQYPKKAPFLPAKAIGALARYSFNLLVIPLIYTTIAQSVTPSSLGTYWFVVVAAVVVTAIAFGAATLLYHCGSCTKTTTTTTESSQQQLQQRRRDFNALRVAIAFPNIVALPILIFPSLCEYPVVYQQAIPTALAVNATASSSSIRSASDVVTSVQQCVEQSNAMIFCYFFVWTLLFYGVGYPYLLPPTTSSRHEEHDNQNHRRQSQSTVDSTIVKSSTTFMRRDDDDDKEDGNASINEDVEGQPVRTTPKDESSHTNNASEPQARARSSCNGNNHPDTIEDEDDDNQRRRRHDRAVFWKFVKDITWGSPGMMAMFLGFITACIPPLRHALFDSGGYLRFIGSALETMGLGSTPVSTMVVAASLVPLAQEPAVAPVAVTSHDEAEQGETIDDDMVHAADHQLQRPRQRRLQFGRSSEQTTNEPSEYFESPVMSDPNFGPLQYQPRPPLPPPTVPLRQDRLRRSQLMLTAAIRKSSLRLSTTLRTTPEMRRLHIWFIMTRLVVTPALVVACLWGFEWSGLLHSVPTLAKLVVVVNSALPGALIVVVILQASLPPNQGDSGTAKRRDSSTAVGGDTSDDTKDNDDHQGGLSQVQTAAVVTKVYLTSYLLSIITISAWTSLGLWILLPRNGA